MRSLAARVFLHSNDAIVMCCISSMSNTMDAMLNMVRTGVHVGVSFLCIGLRYIMAV